MNTSLYHLDYFLLAREGQSKTKKVYIFTSNTLKTLHKYQRIRLIL